MVRVKGFVGKGAAVCSGSAIGAAKVEARRRRRVVMSSKVIFFRFGAVNGNMVVEVNRESGFVLQKRV
jgi:hypothetical protein